MMSGMGCDHVGSGGSVSQVGQEGVGGAIRDAALPATIGLGASGCALLLAYVGLRPLSGDPGPLLCTPRSLTR